MFSRHGESLTTKERRNEVENIQPFLNPEDANWAARNMAMQKRTTVRVVDDWGNVCGVAAFGMPR